MRLPEVCIKHPVFASVLSIAIVILGLLAFQKLDIKYFPEYETPSASVQANITGASAEFMSRNVADKLINAVTGLDGIDTMTTNCSENSCSLDIRFFDDVDYDNTMNKLRSNIDAVNDFPPSMTDKPTVTDDSGKTNSASNIILFTTSDNSPEAKQAMHDHISQQLVPQIKHLPGVGAVWGPYGGSSKAVRVWLQPERMSALNVSASQVVSTLSSFNATFTAGTIKGEVKDFAINPINQLDSIDDVKNLVLRVDNGKIVRIKDIAKVEMGEESLSPSQLSVDGSAAMSLQILPLSSANPVTVAETVQAKIEQINTTLPDNMTMEMVYNQANFIDAAISEGFKTILEAVVLVSAVILLFLGNIRIASIPIITIPVCVIGVFAVMYVLGFSINVLTILAIILAIGLVVDDAIVVAENCYRHIEKGATPLEAALKGSKEIVFPVISMTLTLAVVYMPIGFMSGLTANLFKQFSFTLSAAVIISGIVALTLSPMMSARLMRPVTKKPRWFAVIDAGLNRLTDGYITVLKKWLNRKAILASATVVLLGLAGAAYWHIPQVLLPTEDSGFIEVSSDAPTGAGRSYHEKHNNELNSIFTEQGSIQTNLSYIEGAPTNHVLLKPWGERTEDIDQVIADLIAQANKELSAYNVSFTVRSADSLNVATGLDLQVTTLDRDTETLAKIADTVVKLLEDYPGLTNVVNSMLKDQLQYDLTIDRNALALSGVNYGDITNALSTFLGSVKATDLQSTDGFTYPVQVQLNRAQLSDFSILNKIYVNSESGQSLPLSQFVSIKQTTGESNFLTYMGEDSAKITATLMPGYSASDIKTFIDKEVPNLLQASQQYHYNGVVKDLVDSQQGTLLLFLLAVVFVYLILAAQFESFVDPLIILLTVPLCIVGALLTLAATGQSMNIYTNIGLLTLVGLVTKHGILLVEFANTELKRGLTPVAAALSSAQSRLRPILMTAITMILGSLPLALASGPGSIGRINIGLVLVGGLIAGTFFSLFVVPIAYVAMEKLKNNDIWMSFKSKTA